MLTEGEKISEWTAVLKKEQSSQLVAVAAVRTGNYYGHLEASVLSYLFTGCNVNWPLVFFYFFFPRWCIWYCNRELRAYTQWP